MPMLNKPNVSKALEDVIRSLNSIERLAQTGEPLYMTGGDGQDHLAADNERLLAIDGCVKAATVKIAF